MSGELVMVGRAELRALLAIEKRTVYESDPNWGLVLRRCKHCDEKWECFVSDTNIKQETHDFDCPVTALLMPDPRPMALLESAIDKLASHEEQQHTEARDDLLELWNLLGGYDK